MTKTWCAAALLAVSSCAKCDGTRAAFDAGPLVHRSTDVRNAVMSAMPEFRETHVLSGTALLRRTLEGEPRALEDDVRKAVAANGWKEEPPVAGSKVLAAGKEPFHLEVERKPHGVELRLWMPIHDGDPAKFMAAPISLTTEQMAMYFPRIEGLTAVRERFEVDMVYETTQARAAFLVWQLIDFSTRGAWKLQRVPDGYEVGRKADGGIGDVPDRVALAMEDAATTARVSVDRDGKQVRLEYQLDTLAPP